MRFDLLLVPAFFAALLVSAAPIITAGPGLTEATWSDVAQGTWLVEHYSPYCGHCRAFAPKWRDLVDLVSTPAKDHNFHFAQVDCAANGDLCNSNGVDHYPTLFLYKDGKRIDEYNGGRSVQSLKKYVEEKWDPIDEAEVASATGDDGVVDGDGVGDGDEDGAAADEEELEGKVADTTPPRKILPIEPARPKARLPSEDGVLVGSPIPPAALTAPSPLNPPLPVQQRPGKPVSLAFLLKQGHEDHDHEEKRSSPPATADGEVHVLSPGEVPGLRDPKAGPAFVKYYANWCGHCKKLAPTWSKLAGELKGRVSVFEIDCDLAPNKKACSVEKIKAYPTLIFYNEGAKVEYNGLRNLERMTEFALKAADSTAVRSIANEYELKRATATEDVIFLFLHPSDASPDDLTLAKDASKALIGGPPFYTSSSPDLFNLFSLPSTPIILVFKEHSLTPSSSLSFPTNPTRLSEWLRTAKLTFVSELSSSTYHDIMPATGTPPLVALAFLSPKRLGTRFEATKKEVEDLARGWTARKKAGREVVWAWVDADKWAGWAKSLYGIRAKGEEAWMVVADPKTLDFWKDGLGREPLTTRTGAALYSLVEDGIYTGAARPQSSRNFVDRLGITISNISTQLTGGAVDHPFLTLFFVLISVGAAYWGIKKLDVGGQPDYAKLE